MQENLFQVLMNAVYPSTRTDQLSDEARQGLIKVTQNIIRRDEETPFTEEEMKEIVASNLKHSDEDIDPSLVTYEIEEVTREIIYRLSEIASERDQMTGDMFVEVETLPHHIKDSIAVARKRQKKTVDHTAEGEK